jgi:four helix bundle protein
VSNYKELIVWNVAHKLVLNLYKESVVFPKEERYGYTSQLRRAAVSIPNNIAEGQGRSNNKEFINFIRIAKGSATEVEYLILLGRDLGYINNDKYTYYNNEIIKILRMLNNLIKSLRKLENL